MIKKGIILAGGHGTRMSPLTKAVNKQLLPIYDKPLIFYPLSILMLAGIKDILIIVNQGQTEQFKKIIPEGENLGVKISYAEQNYPKGLPEAFIIGEKFIGKNKVALILGDNFFYGQGLSEILKKKILLHKIVKKVEVEDKSFLHRNHESSETGKFHIILKIESDELKKKNKIDSNRFIYKILDYEIKIYIHSLQIEFI